MANSIVVGMQWGDEGKGKVVDLLCAAFDVVTRYQGGHNAGHTVKFGDQHFALHLVPSGILRSGTKCVLGNGLVINPNAFLEEIAGLQGAGIDVGDRLYISNRAQVLLPDYAEIDMARETAMGMSKIGTTARGIGPAYELKAARYGLRMCDLVSPALPDLVERLLGHLGHLKTGTEKRYLLNRLEDWRLKLAPFIADTSNLLHTWMAAGENILLEGAQGTLLDLDHGTYPYVSSSSSTTGGACTGTGIPPRAISGTLGVLKAYVTRVGGGPFVTELDPDDSAEGEVGKYLGDRGNEFGTTTGRPRRCGWFDAVAARYAQRVNGIDTIALTKIDVLDDLEEIKICTGYRIDGEEVDVVPASAVDWERAEPIYRTVPGWKQTTVGTLRFEDLPEAAQRYVQLIETEAGAPVSIVSSGPRREETIVRADRGLEALTADRLGVLRNELS